MGARRPPPSNPWRPPSGDAPQHRGQPVRTAKHDATVVALPALPLVDQVLQDRLLLPLIWDDRPGDQVDQGTEEGEERERGHYEHHAYGGHREAEVVGEAGAHARHHAALALAVKRLAGDVVHMSMMPDGRPACLGPRARFTLAVRTPRRGSRHVA